MSEIGENWKLFQDSVHGAIQFHPLIVRVIDTEVFQRLRYIKQLSMTYYVFPAASHNRFEHSIGVCYLARTMLEELEKHSDRDLMDKIGLTDAERLCVQIAGLCHDLGHGPFSHTWEVFLSSKGKSWKHEKASVQLFESMLNEVGKDGRTLREEFRHHGLSECHEDLIKRLIMGDASDCASKNRAFLFQIVANKCNDLDVDKWDYFLRDGQNLRMKISFDYERCIKQCKVVEKTKGGETTIAFRDKEAYSIAGMFKLRADLYMRAYHHRVSKCLEVMLLDVFRAADAGFTVRGTDEHNVSREYRLSEAHENVEAFCKITDHIHPQIQFSSSKDLGPAREICRRICKRDLYPLVGEWSLQPLPTEGDDLGRTPKSLKQKDLSELEDLLEGKYAVTLASVSNGEFKNPLKKIHFFSKSNPDGPVEPPELAERSLNSLQLPFYTLFVFSRDKSSQKFKDKSSQELKSTVDKVNEFLKEKNVYQEG